ncbi:MAG: AraC family transcriptional regulator [Verrucomicrobiota bacterium JB022]|nr:AraC family transcriptional regulator [Verrucomicrobiota bacterium JB022]
MDLLTDILQQAGLQRAVLRQREGSAPWVITCRCDRSIAFHLVRAGQVTIEGCRCSQRLELEPGDLVMLARGFDHTVTTRTPAGQEVAVISGHYRLWNDPVHMIFRELPTTFVLRGAEAEEIPAIRRLLPVIEAELADLQMGADSARRGLLDVLFNYLLRAWLDRHTGSETGWAGALQDPQLVRVFTLLHTQWTRSWTLDELASESGFSRPTLARRFKQHTGDTPLHYLTTLRVQRAMHLLSNTLLPIGAVADQCGYSDAFVFSKAFKRLTGESPRDFRQRNLAEAVARQEGEA